MNALRPLVLCCRRHRSVTLVSEASLSLSSPRRFSHSRNLCPAPTLVDLGSNSVGLVPNLAGLDSMLVDLALSLVDTPFDVSHFLFGFRCHNPTVSTGTRCLFRTLALPSVSARNSSNTPFVRVRVETVSSSLRVGYFRYLGRLLPLLLVFFGLSFFSSTVRLPADRLGTPRSSFPNGRPVFFRRGV